MALTAAALLGAGSALPSPAHALALPKVSNISDSSPGDGGSANSNLVTGLANHTEFTFEVRAVNDIGPGIAARAVATPSVSSESGRGICNRTPAVRDRPMVLLGQALTPACTGDCAGVTDVWLARLTSVQLVAPAIGPHRSGVAMRCGAHLLVIEAALYRHESTARNPSTIVVPGSRAIACVNVQERLVIRETREPFAVAMMPVHKCEPRLLAAAVSARALMSLWPMLGSFAHPGISPQRSMESRRPPSSSRTTAAFWLGARL